jgi:long-chain acyl-CoA synthetase
VVDDGARLLGVDEVGQLEVLPPRRTESYATGESVDDRITPDGYWRTGDLARIDGDGFVWIEGRVGEVINRGGHKIYPDHVEEVLRLHPAVRDSAVVGRADDRLGEVPVAYVVLVDGFETDSTELAAWVRSQLVAYKVPVEFIAVAELPRNEIGKVLRVQLGQLPGRR